jgi:hypothetical protein
MARYLGPARVGRFDLGSEPFRLNTHAPEHASPLSPVYTSREGERGVVTAAGGVGGECWPGAGGAETRPAVGCEQSA